MQNGGALTSTAAANNHFQNSLMCGFMSPNGSTGIDMLPGAMAPNFSQLQFPPGAVIPPNSAPLQLMAAMAAAYNGINVSAPSPLTTPAASAAAAAIMNMQRQQQASTSNSGSTTTTPSVSKPISTTKALTSISPTQTSNSTLLTSTTSTNSSKKMPNGVTNGAQLLNNASNNVIDGIAAAAAQQQLAMLSAQYGAANFPFNLNATNPAGINPFMMLAANTNFDPAALAATANNAANFTNLATNNTKYFFN